MEEVQDTLCKVVITAGSKALLLKRSQWVIYNKGKWDLPGGILDPGEDYESAAIRECIEEAGIVIDPEKLKLIAQETGDRKGRVALRVCFVAELDEEVKPRLSFEHSKYKWLTLDEILETDLNDFYKGVCKQILS